MARTGRHHQFKGYVAALDLWMEAEAFPARTPGQVAVLFSNVTERKRSEEALRRAAELDAFRIALADALRPLSNAVEVQAVASRLLGEHLGVLRAFYAEVAPDDEHIVVTGGYASDGPPLVGRFRMDDFGVYAKEHACGGRVLVVTDVLADRLSAEAAIGFSSSRTARRGCPTKRRAPRGRRGGPPTSAGTCVKTGAAFRKRCYRVLER